MRHARRRGCVTRLRAWLSMPDSGVAGGSSSRATAASRARGSPRGCCAWAPTCAASRSTCPTTPSLFELAGLGDDVATTWADIRDAAAVREAVAQAAPEVVIHMAAQPFVRRSFREPRETYETNVMGTVNVLDAVRTTDGVRVVVNVTSDKCYDNREQGRPFREDDPKGGHDPYSNSKGCAELVADAYLRSFFAPDPDGPRLGSGRAGNVIGGGDWGEDRLVPDIMRGALAGAPIRIRNPAAVRPWQHVLNPLSGYLKLAERAVGGPGRRRRLELRARSGRRAAGGPSRRAGDRGLARHAGLGDRRGRASARGRAAAARLVEGPRGARLGARLGAGRRASTRPSAGTPRCATARTCAP